MQRCFFLHPFAWMPVAASGCNELTVVRLHPSLLTTTTGDGNEMH